MVLKIGLMNGYTNWIGN